MITKSRPQLKGNEVTFDDDGNPTIEGHGFSKADGNLCEKKADEIMAALGGTMTGREHKPEFAAVTPKSNIKAGA